MLYKGYNKPYDFTKLKTNVLLVNAMKSSIITVSLQFIWQLK